MSQQSVSKKQPVSRGDAAVDGLFGGMAAGLGMAAYLLVAVIVAGNSPVKFFAELAPGEGTSPITGGLLHVAVSGIYGVVFGIVGRYLPGLRSTSRAIANAAGGIVYGLVLVMAAQLIVLPATETSLAEVPPGSLIVAHVLYGFVLGLLTAGRRVA